MEADEAGAAAEEDIDMAGSEDEEVAAAPASMDAGAGAVDGSAGWDSMPQEVRLPMNLFDSEVHNEAAVVGASQAHERDVEMADGEEAGEADADEAAARAYDSEPEETARIQRPRRRR